MNELPRKTLCDIVATYGTAVYEDPRRFEALLLDLCPAYRKEIRVLTGALDEKVPHALLNSSPNLAVELLMPQMIQRLINNLAINEEASEWSVHSWALALKIISVSEIERLSKVQPKHVNSVVQPIANRNQTELSQELQNSDNYILPPLEFLTAPPPPIEQEKEELLAVAQEITDKAREFNVAGRMTHICQGPVVTTYEFKLDSGVKSSRLTSLTEDLGMSVNAPFLSIQKIPEKNVYGIIIPNDNRETVYLREVIESKKFRESKSLLTIALGKTMDGLNYVTDLSKMPNLFIVGEVNSGKSILLHTIINSILYKARPDEVKFILVDPKRLELGLYADIPHLAIPVITDPKRAAISLEWAVSEMENRFKELNGWSARNIDDFNAEVDKRNAVEHFDDEGNPYKKLPLIVIIIDDLADLIENRETQESIKLLTQTGFVVGLHVVFATQRLPDKTIKRFVKEHFRARLSLRVSSKADSQVILDADGAEFLLGRGDLLFLPPASLEPIRVHGGFVDEKEINQIVQHVKAQGKPEYDTARTKTDDELIDSDNLPGRNDVLFVDALRTVVQSKRASTALLQRYLRIGYGRAAAILDAMVHEGYIGDMDGSSRARPVLQKAFDDLKLAETGEL